MVTQFGKSTPCTSSTQPSSPPGREHNFCKMINSVLVFKTAVQLSSFLETASLLLRLTLLPCQRWRHGGLGEAEVHFGSRNLFVNGVLVFCGAMVSYQERVHQMVPTDEQNWCSKSPPLTVLGLKFSHRSWFCHWVLSPHAVWHHFLLWLFVLHLGANRAVL